MAIDILSSWSALDRFLNGGPLAKTLQVIGDVHFEAAFHALKEREGAVEREADLREARTHLRAAHVVYRKKWHGRRGMTKIALSGGAAAWALDNVAFKDVVACQLIALTYMHFRDWEAAAEYLDLASEAQSFMMRNSKSTLLSVLRVDRLIATQILIWRLNLPDISVLRKQLEQLRASA